MCLFLLPQLCHFYPHQLVAFRRVFFEKTKCKEAQSVQHAPWHFCRNESSKTLETCSPRYRMELRNRYQRFRGENMRVSVIGKASKRASIFKKGTMFKPTEARTRSDQAPACRLT